MRDLLMLDRRLCVVSMSECMVQGLSGNCGPECSLYGTEKDCEGS
jgi:hypothetical protein